MLVNFVNWARCPPSARSNSTVVDGGKLSVHSFWRWLTSRYNWLPAIPRERSSVSFDRIEVWIDDHFDYWRFLNPHAFVPFRWVCGGSALSDHDAKHDKDRDNETVLNEHLLAHNRASLSLSTLLLSNGASSRKQTNIRSPPRRPSAKKIRRWVEPLLVTLLGQDTNLGGKNHGDFLPCPLLRKFWYFDSAFVAHRNTNEPSKTQKQTQNCHFMIPMKQFSATMPIQHSFWFSIPVRLRYWYRQMVNRLISNNLYGPM